MRAEHLNMWLAMAQKAEKEKEKSEKEAATMMERAGMTENGETSAAQTYTEAYSWMRVMELEAVSRRFKISSTTFHITSPRPMPR